MSAEQVVTLVFAVGSGVTIGWLWRSYWGKLNPEGIVRAAQMFGEELAATRAEAKANRALDESRFENERQAWREYAASFKQRTMPVAPMVMHAPMPPPPATNGTNGNTEHAKLRSTFIGAGYSPETADANASKILNGEDVPLDPAMEALVDAEVRSETGTQ